LPPPDKDFAGHLLITGSQAMGLGAVHAGVRLYAGYPMTPSSPLLSFIAELESKTHMVVKQAEDEITAAQIVSGAMYMGTRALTATSGVGFDLMSETLSLNAMIENPTVFVLAQRPGPATGLPTWTAQGGLLQAASCSAGEFTRCVISVSNSQDAFDLMPVTFNLAEQYQISIIALIDKQIAEALYTQHPYDLQTSVIDRGRLVVDPEKRKFLKSSDRFDPHAKDGRFVAMASRKRRGDLLRPRRRTRFHGRRGRVRPQYQVANGKAVAEVPRVKGRASRTSFEYRRS
jgi:2-oxoglutarate ferredoxin oxidoreductase subunit alpha